MVNQDKRRASNHWGNDKYSINVLRKTGEKSVVKREMKINLSLQSA